MKTKVYYDKDADTNILKSEVVGIIGYGIQGRAQALNLRDSKANIIIGNKEDAYAKNITKDGFERLGIGDVAKKASIIMMLIPDQAHKQVFYDYIKENLSEGDMIVFAHGYSIRFNEIELPKNIDVVLLAPRMPGDPIRDYYLEGRGVPAFFDVYQDSTGKAKERGLALAKALGFTKAGVMQVSISEETELDLFMEQFLIPSIIRTMKISFDVLIKKGYSPEAVLMELYASGELGEVILKAAKLGLYEVFRKNASPTCQFGISQKIEEVLSEEKQKEVAEKILKEIKDGTFSKALDEEGNKGYPKLKAYDKKNDNSEMTKTYKKLKKLIKI